MLIDGPVFISSKNLQKRDMMVICDYLQNELRKGYKFIPDKEGIVMSDWLGKQDKMVKKIKFLNQNTSFHDDVIDLNLWNESFDVLCQKETKIQSYLYTSDDAPEWTQDEITKLEKCFHKIGLIKFSLE